MSAIKLDFISEDSFKQIFSLDKVYLKVTKSTYKIKLRKMTSLFDLLSRTIFIDLLLSGYEFDVTYSISLQVMKEALFKKE